MAVQDRPRKLTTADFRALEDLPENANRILELIEGEVIEKIPRFVLSKLAARIATYIGMYLLQNDIGHLTGADGGYVISESDTFNPDVGYISKERLPVLPEREVLVPPDFAVEVKSPTDTRRALRRKAEKYLESGTRLVWLVFPESRTVEVYVPDKDDVPKGMDEILDGGEVLPGFQLAVKDIFPD